MTEVAIARPERDIEVVLPVIPVGWRVLIRSYEPPKHSAGGVALPDDVMESEELLSYVGQIVAMGNLCYKAVSRSGIDLADVDPQPKVGDWIMYGTYGGQKVVTKTGTKYLMMNDDCIMGIVPDPTVFRAYI